MNKKLLISFEEYLAIGKHNQPYIYSIDHAGKILFYFGAKHTKDPTHPQFPELKKEWMQFREKIQDRESVVIYEGIVDIDSGITLEGAIEKYGESGSIVFLARESGILSVRPEPSIKFESSELLKEFTKEEVFYFYIMRGLVSRARNSDLSDFDAYITKAIGRYKNELGWAGFDCSYEPTFIQTHTKIFNEKFDITNKDFLNKIISPINYESRINEIARMSTTIRNIEILNVINEYWTKGYNIFVVYGASHAVMQERVIKDLVNE